MPTLEKAEQRSKQVKKNVVISFLVKGLSLLINLIFVPLTINYVNSERYGLWLTLSSIISWFNLLDIGFGNGLRNRFAEATAKNDVEQQRSLVQTTLVSLLSISSILFLIYILFFKNLNWDEILGVSKNYRNELKMLMVLLIGLFSIQFVLQIYNPIQYALQKSGKVSLTLLIGSLLGLVGILILKRYFEPSLTYLGLVVMGGNILSLTIFTGHYFFFKRPDLFKNFQLPKFHQIGDIFSLGFKFFIINIAYVVQFQTSNFLISKYIAVEKVTEFNIAFKLFSTLSIVFGIIISPIWSSVTNAKINNDFKWIRNIVKRLVLLWLGSCIVCILLVILSPTLYYYWVGDKVKIPFETTIGVAMIVCTNTFSSIFIHILNGLSRVKVQFILAIIVIFIFMPVAYLLAIKLQLGIFGLCLAIVITSINGLIVAPIQVYKEISK